MGKYLSNNITFKKWMPWFIIDYTDIEGGNIVSIPSFLYW